MELSKVTLIFFNLFLDVNYFKLDTIQDCSNAINLGNKRKKMRKGHSVSHTIFKIVLRFFEDDHNIYEEASLVLLDVAYEEDKKFVNLSQLDCEDVKEHLRLPRNLHWEHNSTCRMIKSIHVMKMKNAFPQKRVHPL